MLNVGEGLRQALPRLVLESVLIAFSLILALAIDEWREGQGRLRRVEHAVDNILQEIEANLAELEARTPYHLEVVADIDAWLSGEGRRATDRTPFDLLQRMAPHGLYPPTLRRSAWDSALNGRAIADLDFDRMYRLSGLFRAQAEGVAATVPRIVEEILTRPSFSPDTPLEPFMEMTRMMIAELASQEESLMYLCRSALEELRGTPDQPDGSD